MKTTPLIETHGDEVVVVARSAEEAQQAAMDVLGPLCTVTAVDRVRSGGVGGFFATEMVRLTARHRAVETAPTFTGSDSEMEAVLASAEDLVASLNRRTAGFAERLLDEINAVSGVDAETPRSIQTLAEMLRAAGEPPTTAAAPTPSPVAPAAAPVVVAPATPVAVVPPITPITAPVVAAPAVATPSAFTPVAEPAPAHRAVDRSGWSAAALRVLGVPDSLVTAVTAEQPHDDISWTTALMNALRPLCTGPRPGTSLIVGPACANLARQLRFMSITAEELPDTLSSVAVPHVSAAQLASGAQDRTVHLVVGGAWQHLATVPVATVSAATDDDLMDALRVAAAWGATLGWTWQGERYERIDPFVVAGRIRDGILATRQAPVLSGSPGPHGDDPTVDAVGEHIPVR